MRRRCMKMLAPDGTASGGIATAVTEAVETALETPPEKPEKKKEEKNEPQLTDEASFLIRRISEEVIGGVAKLLKPAEDTALDDDAESDAPKRKRRSPTPKPPEKRSGGISLGFSIFKR